jgi:mRNA-degrading endonuclease RelE of RelBE toxin-antitoxin system
MAHYSIALTETAKAEIRALRASDRTSVLAAIKGLTTAPNVESGHRKVLRGLVPPWTQVRPVWQLTVELFRVFYDIDEAAREVIINAVPRKPAGKKTEDIP